MELIPLVREEPIPEVLSLLHIPHSPHDREGQYLVERIEGFLIALKYGKK
jgi:hypothetical protein